SWSPSQARSRNAARSSTASSSADSKTFSMRFHRSGVMQTSCYSGGISTLDRSGSFVGHLLGQPRLCQPEVAAYGRHRKVESLRCLFFAHSPEIAQFQDVGAAFIESG